MEKVIQQSQPSPRAAASIIFSCFALFLWRIYDELHLLVPKRLMFGMTEQLTYADRDLMLACFIVASAGTIWCLWSWFKEPRSAARLATLFAVLTIVILSRM